MTKQNTNEQYLNEMTWEEKAKINPLYAVMSINDFSDSSSKPSEEELTRFFQEGRRKVEKWFLPWLQQRPSHESMLGLEFGCGMGRLLNAFYEKNIKCHGVDISETMISWARNYLPESIQVKTIDPDKTIPFPDRYFDFVYSYAVFQHIKETSVFFKSIDEICRVLKPGGHVKLQFAMLYPYIRDSLVHKGDTYAFETASIVHGWTRKFSIPLWRVRVHKHNNWGGTRPGYKQIFREFKKHGIRIYGIENDPELPLINWFYGIKE